MLTKVNRTLYTFLIVFDKILYIQDLLTITQHSGLVNKKSAIQNIKLLLVIHISNI